MNEFKNFSEELAEVSREKEIKAQKKRLEPFFKDESFRLYSDKEKRDDFRHEVEAMCRHAFAMQADVTLFFDKSARGYGLLAHYLLPVLRLEFAKMNNIPVEQVKPPEIKFFDPETKFKGSYFHPRWELESFNGGQIVRINTEDEQRLGSALDLTEQKEDEYLQNLKERMGPQLQGKRVLLCDEATPRDTVGIKGDSPEAQYEYFKSKKWEDYKKVMDSGTNDWGRELRGLLKDFIFEPHTGGSQLKGGKDIAHTDLFSGSVLWGISSKEPKLYDLGNMNYWGRNGKEEQDLQVLGDYSPLAIRSNERTDDDEEKLQNLGFSNPNELREQLRKEFKGMAGESFKELVHT